jgi:hypothetical protein
LSSLSTLFVPHKLVKPLERFNCSVASVIFVLQCLSSLKSPSNVSEDTSPPTVTIHLPDAAPLRFPVAWSGDDECGVRHYDVQYKAGAGGTWTGWLTATTQTEAVFLGQSNQTYYFRIQATDNVSNTSAWIESGPVTIQAVRKNYYHGDQLVATRRGDEVYFIHGDHPSAALRAGLGSTSLTTDIFERA